MFASTTRLGVAPVSIPRTGEEQYCIVLTVDLIDILQANLLGVLRKGSGPMPE